MGITIDIPSASEIKDKKVGFRHSKEYKEMLEKGIKYTVDDLQDAIQRGHQYLCLRYHDFDTCEKLADEYDEYWVNISHAITNDILKTFIQKGYRRFYHPTQTPVYITWLDEDEITVPRW